MARLSGAPRKSGVLSTKVSIALQGTGSSSYQRKIIILACSHTITQQKILSLGLTRAFVEKKSGPAHHPNKKHQSLPFYISSIAAKKCHSDMLSPSATPLWSLLFLPRWSLPTSILTYPIPNSTHAPQISARRSWSLFCVCPSFIC